MSKVKSIGEKVAWSEKDGVIYVTISAAIEKWQENLILMWVALWSGCGAVVIWYLLFGGAVGDERLFFLAYLSFWAYFEYKSIRSLMWRKFGAERIRLDDEKMTYKRDIRSYGKARHYYFDNVEKLQAVDLSEKSYAKVFGKSFWVMGGETLQFTYQKRVVPFAMQLEERDAKGLLHLIKQELRQRRKA